MIVGDDSDELARKITELVASPRFLIGADAQFLRDSAALGPAGDELLARALRSLIASDAHWADYDGMLVAKALADGSGDAGPSALRAAIRAPAASRDLQCAVLISLVSRCGSDATADAAYALTSRSPDVSEYGALCLAVIGDNREWEAVFSWLQGRLSRPRKSSGRDTISAVVCYLARNLGGAERLDRLVQLLRSRWRRLGADDAAWIERHWLGIRDSSEKSSRPFPDVSAMQRSFSLPA